MQFTRIAMPISVATVLLTTATAFAGTSVTNSTSTRVSSGSGTGYTNVVRNSSGVQQNYSESLKMESLGQFSNASVGYNTKREGLMGSSFASSVAVDPVAVGTHSSQSEFVKYNQSSDFSATEHYNFSEFGTDHTVSSDSSF